MNPVLMQEIQAVARQAEAAGRGERRAILEAGAARLGMSVPTLYRKLQEVTVRPQRKRRSDAGKTGIPLKELQLISALLVESIRKNQKQLSSVKLAVERLRSNGLIMAGRVNEQTGLRRSQPLPSAGRCTRQTCTLTRCWPRRQRYHSPAGTPTTYGRWMRQSRRSSTLPTTARR